jgi:site-specific DNA-adenine methylase
LVTFQEAEKFYRKVWSIQEKVLRPDNPDLADTYNRIIESLREQNKHKEVLEFERMATISKEYTLPFDTMEKKTRNISPILRQINP